MRLYRVLCDLIRDLAFAGMAEGCHSLTLDFTSHLASRGKQTKLKAEAGRAFRLVDATLDQSSSSDNS